MKIKIDTKTIDANSNVFIVAELSANHQQDINVAIKTVKEMKKAGADAVKVQTFLPEDMTMDIDSPMFRAREGTLWSGKKLFDLYKQAYLPWEWHAEIKKIAEDLGLVFFSSPLSKSAVDFLEGIGVSAYKIASPEIVDIPLIEYVSSKGKPVILSTGVATLADVEDAVNACINNGNNQIAILKCTTSYPAPFEQINLRTIPNIIETFKVVAGISDHTLGISVPIAAVSLGAKIVEKHFILNKNLGGPDCKFSLEPDEFAIMVKSIREVEKALGSINYNLSDEMKLSRRSVRSLFAVEDIESGENLTEKNIRSLRPGYGLEPKYMSQIIGKKANKFINKGTPLSWSLINL